MSHCRSVHAPPKEPPSTFSLPHMQQQAKISAFLKPSHPIPHHPPHLPTHHLHFPSSPITYKRRNPNSGYAVDDVGDIESRPDEASSDAGSLGKDLSKKRRYVQYHLELGQSDFLLYSCALCGLMYARGDEEDERVHKAFHKSYYQGIAFKGWRNERVVSTHGDNRDRIVLVLDGDPLAQKNKVKEVIKVMEKELGFSDGQLLHKLCKVYLFVSRQKIIGCLVAEPIRKAHRVVPNTSQTPELPTLEADGNDPRRLNTTIKFGDFNFQREVVKRDCLANKTKVDQWDCGAILCQEEAVPAVCGIRAIWVVPSSRRKRIASKLMDASRNSFCAGQLLEPSQYAFSPPTSSGKAFACSYNNMKSFLVYRAEDI